ncbi:MAG: XRE family transcriptional regulator [Cyclobacteriaceae bacterium]|nr:XRE family transcriptional regulator [Cyclobacteriaceae bacterium]
MNTSKKKRLEANGWKVGSSAEFLNLTAEEAAYVEFKVALSKALLHLRKSRKLTQVDLALRINSSQSRVAKMEAADASVSLDLMLRSLFALGASRNKVAELLKAS